VDDVYNYLSDLEKKVFNWLSSHEIPFTYQQRMYGDRGELGSATVDFILTDRNIALRCMGSYWHSGLEANARDAFGKERLINDGYIVIDLWDEMLEDDRIDSTMEMAVQGIEVIR